MYQKLNTVFLLSISLQINPSVILWTPCTSFRYGEYADGRGDGKSENTG